MRYETQFLNEICHLVAVAERRFLHDCLFDNFFVTQQQTVVRPVYIYGVFLTKSYSMSPCPWPATTKVSCSR